MPKGTGKNSAAGRGGRGRRSRLSPSDVTAAAFDYRMSTRGQNADDPKVLAAYAKRNNFSVADAQEIGAARGMRRDSVAAAMK